MFIVFEETGERRKANDKEWVLDNDVIRSMRNHVGQAYQYPILTRHEFETVEQLTAWAASKCQPGTMIDFGAEVNVAGFTTPVTTLESTEPSRRERIMVEFGNTLLGNERAFWTLEQANNFANFVGEYADAVIARADKEKS